VQARLEEEFGSGYGHGIRSAASVLPERHDAIIVDDTLQRYVGIRVHPGVNRCVRAAIQRNVAARVT
jgi:hypothetical protein